MHIADVKIPNNWTPLSDFATVGADDTFVLVNSSPDQMYMVESNTIPASTVIGVIVAPEEYVVYKKGAQANLYIKNGAVPVVTAGVPQIKLSNLTINKVG